MGEDIDYVLINDLATLAWTANIAALELHPFLHRAPQIDRPTHIFFDLDPGEGSDILDCARVALLLRDVLTKLRLKSCAKVSGSKGIQVYVPLNVVISYEVTQPFGFNPASRARLLPKMHLLLTPKCPFDNLPTGKKSHFDEGITAEEMKELRWLKPKLVAQISFTEWTNYGLLRHATFEALRDDKDATEVGREVAA